jgi:DUF2934 family protein
MAKRTARRDQQPQPSEAGVQAQGTSDDRAPVAVMDGDDVRAEAREPEPDAIARRAYEIYCERGCADGRDMDDWLQAENELRNMK